MTDIQPQESSDLNSITHQQQQSACSYNYVQTPELQLSLGQPQIPQESQEASCANCQKQLKLHNEIIVKLVLSQRQAHVLAEEQQTKLKQEKEQTYNQLVESMNKEIALTTQAQEAQQQVKELQSQLETKEKLILEQEAEISEQAAVIEQLQSQNITQTQILQKLMAKRAREKESTDEEEVPSVPKKRRAVNPISDEFLRGLQQLDEESQDFHSTQTTQASKRAKKSIGALGSALGGHLESYIKVQPSKPDRSVASFSDGPQATVASDKFDCMRIMNCVSETQRRMNEIRMKNRRVMAKRIQRNYRDDMQKNQ